MDSFGVDFEDGTSENTSAVSWEPSHVWSTTQKIIGFRASFATGLNTGVHPDYNRRIELLQKLSLIYESDCDDAAFVFDEAHATPVTANAANILFQDNWSYPQTVRWETPSIYESCTDTEPTLIYDQGWTLHSGKNIAGTDVETIYWYEDNYNYDLAYLKAYAKQ